MPKRTDLLVVGAGPYAYSAAACARANGIETHIVGRSMAFWQEQMPAEMFLRSGPDWHLDAEGAYTFEAFFEDRRMRPEDFDPIPVAVFVDYAEWFRQQLSLEVDERLVKDPTTQNGAFVATMEDGSTITAEKVVAAPGVSYFANFPRWATDVPAPLRSHTSELVSFDNLAGARVVIIGGRQSAYEWAALLADHGAEQVHVVHRHPTPAFAKVSWAFVNPYVEQTLAQRGWWRRLPAEERQRINGEFWRAGRLTLEPWLVPRLAPKVVTSHPDCAVVDVTSDDQAVRLRLSDRTTLVADQVIFACGYKADLDRVPYLRSVSHQVSTTDGFPDLTEGFETSLPGLHVIGFASTRDFGPFYGFTKGCPSSARIAVDELMRRAA
ncbi:Pyridine nucleotide-disulphide oxidoreductase [Actinopolymorpha cephalotaxi]|uniref:Cation diffusion facilitator CzcD-associated flavoprotein CzcO n=1 Tax=Actinopolymorpha cephalotaxi TaxID=504797 RepID=A0A1I2K806_9ACTN|nr:NAD(P)-binding domain-containing protein [Actinopolymorpha cephalotaxi]NYH84351.1 cation diffusion facilitator CzcD-associated flavoprotein CzcO [Actinopolymorpha cephalotaxi]SFF63285.1 Pyridine nucleotide-disulphide oxidoreductase [Actinopolymorpha cephalotaxi]